MEKIEFAHKELINKFNWSIYKECISHYWNNLLNLLFFKYEFNDVLHALGDNEIEDLKKDILSCIKDLEVILEDEEVLKYLKKILINEIMILKEY